MKIRQILIQAIVLSMALGAITETSWAGEVKNREENQQDRIAQGVNSGALTPQETARLQKGEQKIEANRQTALADGKLTPKEKRKLNRQETKQSKKINKLKHNAKTVPAPTV